MTLKNYSLVLLLFLSGFSLTAQSSVWKDVTVDDQYKTAGPVLTNKLPAAARTISLNAEDMQDLLWQATYPQAKAKGTKVQLPTNKGNFETFEVFRKENVFAPNLIDEYGETIRAFTGAKVGDPTSVVHITMGYGMFNAVTYRPGGVLDYVEYASVLKDGTYMAYRRGEAEFEKLTCHVEDQVAESEPVSAEPKSLDPTQQTQFRIQLTTPGSFTEQFGDLTPTKPEMQTVITGQIMNILNPIYNRDFGVVLLNATNNATIFLAAGPNTPFSNEDNSLFVLFENGVYLNDGQPSAIAGVLKADYDIGHAQVYANSGGVASATSVCMNGEQEATQSPVMGQQAVIKAQGMSGIQYPLLNDFTVDYVAHEVGHQFGCNHTYATVEDPMGGCNTGEENSRYEAGSGTSIMAYVGVCSEELTYPDMKSRSDPFFHAHSMAEALDAIDKVFACKTVTAATNLADPVALPSAATFSIPMGTPFALVGTVTDGEGSPVAAWNQFDKAANDYDGGDLAAKMPTTAGPPMSTNTSGPLFRFSLPSAPVATKVTRILPSNGLQKGTELWEVLPTVARPLTFRLLARDNQTGAGMFGRSASGTTAITVTGDGPMVITSPAMGVAVDQGEAVSVVYMGLPAGICSEVDAFLSTDDGATYPTPLAVNVGNSGSVSVTIPPAATVTTVARIVLQCHTTDGTLLGSSTPFQVSDAFTIKAASLAVDLLSIRADAVDKTNVVSWSTANEIDNEGFDVQRSTDGATWNTLGFVAGRNLVSTQDYNWIDQLPLSGVNYYRLISRDFDGSTELSEVVSVTRGADDLGLSVLPNPAQDQFEIRINGVDFSNTSSVNVQVYTVAGQLVYEQPLSNTSLTVDASALASGVYFVRLTHGEVTATRKLLIK